MWAPAYAASVLATGTGAGSSGVSRFRRTNRARGFAARTNTEWAVVAEDLQIEPESPRVHVGEVEPAIGAE